MTLSSIEADKIEVPRLTQSKSYLKILDIYENSNMPISADTVEKIIKDNHIFNNIILAFRPRVIKVSLKSDTVII